MTFRFRSFVIGLTAYVMHFAPWADAASATSLELRSEIQAEHRESLNSPRFYRLTLTHTADTFFNVYDAASTSKRPGLANLTSIALEANPRWDDHLETRFSFEGLGIQTHSTLLARMPMQSTSSIAAMNGFVISRAFLSQSFSNETAFTLGVFDLNDSFYYTDASVFFLNGTFGVGAEMTSSSTSIVPTFPTTSLGAKVRSPIAGPISVDVGAMNASPAAIDSPLVQRFRWRRDDRALGIVQTNANISIRGQPGTASLGIWAITRLHASSAPLAERGAFLSFSQKIYSRRLSDSSGLFGFIRTGQATGDSFTSDRSVSAGLSYRGIFFGETRDELGIAFAWAHRSSLHRSVLDDECKYQSYHANETVTEMSYRVELVKGLSVQPDIQLSRHAQFAYNNTHQVAVGTRIQGQF